MKNVVIEASGLIGSTSFEQWLGQTVTVDANAR